MTILDAGELSGVANASIHTRFYFDAPFAALQKVVARDRTVLITDDNVFAAQAANFEGWNTIVIPAGEQYKQQAAVDDIIRQLIEREVDRSFTIVGVGGGVVTDIAGYAASIYMRGVRFGFVPTSILAMVDASIGGKNGVDVGVYKNLAGTIRQPDFLWYDYALLQSLPQEEWINGFAEVIKHACIKDAAMFALLEQHSIAAFQQQHALLAQLIMQNVRIKMTVVMQDEFEKGDRKLLNFGHTLGHAIENSYLLPHGHAVSVGMVIAAGFSQKITGLTAADAKRITRVIQQYQLTDRYAYEQDKVWAVLKMDKKRVSNQMNFILLKKLGDAVVHPIALDELEQLIAADVAQ